MTSALIGYTGFVGSNLLRQTHFDDLYNSKNIADIRGKRYDLVVCAAPRADKWWANQNPAEDKANIESLTLELLEIKEAKRFIHISTIDVYDDPVGVVEYSPIDESKQTPYGHNRWLLENTIQAIFPHAQIIRLPGLFGPWLKKNFIYDLIHKQYEFLPHPESTFQFFDIAKLWWALSGFIEVAIPLANLVGEPVSALQIAQCAGCVFTSHGSKPIKKYDVHTKYNGPYLYSAKGTIERIFKFVANETRSL